MSEYEVSLAVANLISAKSSYGKADFEAIAAYVNVMVDQKHADGGGWMDFQTRLYGFFYAFGYESAWDDVTGTFSFWKDDFRFWNWLMEL